MSLNKNTVQKYIDGFNKSDHGQILSCLTDDIEWLMPGTFHLAGRDAFDKEIENDAFTGSPIVKITRMIEEITSSSLKAPFVLRGRTAGSLTRCSVMYLRWYIPRSSA
jgi:hypothetical protein